MLGQGRLRVALRQVLVQEQLRGALGQVLVQGQLWGGGRVPWGRCWGRDGWGGTGG